MEIEKENSDSLEFNPSLVEEEDISHYEDIEGDKTDILKEYLKEIGSYPLLTTEEENRLSSIIMEGNRAISRLEEIENAPEGATASEYEELLMKKASADEAVDKMVCSNLRLVVSIAKHYMNGLMPFMDLVQEGSMGLTRAARKYDHTLGYRFSTYATWWIRQSITRAMSDQSRAIRVPVHIREDMRKVAKERRRLTSLYNRLPSEEELSHATGFSAEKLKELASLSEPVVSMDKEVGDEDGSVLSDFISDNDSKNPLEYTMEEKLKSEIDDVLSKVLNEKERNVIILRYGLQGHDPMTLEQVAKQSDCHVTRERIRQIESKALSKLRRNELFIKIAEAYINK